LQDQQIVSDLAVLKKLSQRYNEIKDIISTHNDLDRVAREISETEKLMKQDTEMSLLCQTELEQLAKQKIKLEKKMADLSSQDNALNQKNIIVEIRAGAGGDEASLFASELFRLYSKFAERHKLTVKIINLSKTSLGGFKEVIFEVSGHGAYGKFKFETGVHRVQRIPDTEKSGRVHTSTASIIALPVPDEVEVIIDQKDLKIEASTASGHGGQSVNTTYSAVRIVHLPTKITVECQDERNFQQNKLRAMTVLRTRLFALEVEKQRKAMESARKTQVATGDRSEKIRTYNFPQDRLTDHRIKKNIHGLEAIINGEIDELIEELQKELKD
jgi:peptide chain release factor 1